MAGERRGESFEVLTFLALRDLGYVRGKSLFWGETPAGFPVDPDFILGSMANPSHWILATSSGSAKNFLEKFWRNVHELFEAKRYFSTSPRVVNLVFEASQRDALQLAFSAITDAEILVERTPYGAYLLEFVRRHEKRLPKNKDDKVVFLADALKKSKAHQRAFLRFRTDLREALRKKKPELEELWKISAAVRPGQKPVTSKETFLRRGLAKLMLLEPSYQARAIESARTGKSLPKIPEFAVNLGIARKGIGGFRIVDSDVVWTVNALEAATLDYLLQASYKARPENWDNWRSMFSQVDVVANHHYVIEHFSELSTAKGMLNHLVNKHSPQGYKWLFTHLMEILKVHSGRRQGYGYSVLAADVGYTKGICKGYLELSDWVNGFLDEPKSKTLLCDVARALAVRIKSVGLAAVKAMEDQICVELFRNLLEQKVVAYWLFEPLPLLAQRALQAAGLKAQYLKKHPTFIGEYLGQPLKIASPTVMVCGSTLICWRSAYDKGKHHKAKELAGRGQALRFEFSAGHFRPRGSIHKMVLLVDGTFTQAQLDMMQGAGWDEIYYPDEMDKFVDAIV